MKHDEIFEPEECQIEYTNDSETCEWLEETLRDLAEKHFPGLKENIDKQDMPAVLDKVIQDSRTYGFENDNNLLIRYAIYTINNGVTPMQEPEFAEAVKKSESIPIGLKDQFCLVDWAARNEELFGMKVEW